MKMARRIVGIDAGYVNFAVCGVNTNDVEHPYHWVNRPLFTGKFSEDRLANAVYAWIQLPEIEQLLNEADEIILERQMTMKFQAVNHCIRFRYFDKTREVHPNTVRAFFNLPVLRKAKKKAAVDLVSSKLVLPVKRGKKDDLADAFLLCLWAGADRDASLARGWVDESAEPQKKKKK